MYVAILLRSSSDLRAYTWEREKEVFGDYSSFASFSDGYEKEFFN